VAVEPQRIRLSPDFFIASTGIHEGKLQQAVHALKYTGARELTAPLGDRLIAALAVLNWTIDTIIPVPLHTSRLRERGYNQSEQLGAYMAQVLGIPCDPSALLRWRDTPPQVGLNREQRQANVRGAFRATTTLAGSVLLIDDVFTTGATMQDCARAAYEAGAQKLYGITVTAARS
jgi:ComF family protein